MRSNDLRLSFALSLLAVFGALAQPALPPGYAGSTACQACHEDIYNALLKSRIA